MAHEFDDSLRLFGQRHRLSPMAQRELLDLVETVARGRLWTPVPSSTTMDRADRPGTLVTVSGPDRAEPAPEAGVVFAERYEDLGCIGMGGMGEVRRVYDRLLQRTLAVKLLRWDNIDDLDARARFMAEAQVNAQLQHPGVVAVHEQGVLPDGRPWFTMREVRGRTLAEAIRAAHRDAAGAPTIRRLIELVARVCRTVAYAHAKGVVHRDIKPANIMLGEFGEVLIMDWGIARVGSTPAARPDSLPPEAVGAPVRRSASLSGETRNGRIMGTPAYMSPEQARGDHAAVGPATDVYALGAVLYHVLTGSPPYAGRSERVIAQVLSGPPPGIDEVRPAELGPAPADLVALCATAMHRVHGERPSAEGLAAAIEGWLDGVLKTTRARAIVAEADGMLPQIEALRAEVDALRRRATAILEPLPDHAPVEQKRPGWDLEDAAREKAQQAELTEVRMLQTLRSALHVMPELPEAHQRLAAYYKRRLLAAEHQRDAHTAQICEELVRTHDRGQLCTWLAGDGRLTLVTDPPGAKVTAYRYVERGRRLEEVFEADLGHTPLREVTLARGSHLLVIERDGCAPVRYPVDIGRGRHWDGIPPDGDMPSAITLPRLVELGPDDIYVPAGWCVLGGDDDAADALSRRRSWLDGYVIRRFPVTNAEYLAFVNDLQASSGLEAARSRLPHEMAQSAGSDPQPIYARGVDGSFEAGVDCRGWQWQSDWPVVDVDWFDATAFARWHAQRSGKPWRLCHGVEHEKAARGVDGRLLPWGDHFENTWANVLNSSAGAPRLAAVGAYEKDVSVYGVHDVVGNVRVWCGGLYRRTGDVEDGGRWQPSPSRGDAPREIRGGCWHSSSYFGRCAGRLGATPDVRYAVLGFRIARPLR